MSVDTITKKLAAMGKPKAPAGGVSSQKSRTPGMKFTFRGTEPSMWSFTEHGVTSSFLGTFLTCREQTRLHYVQGWASRNMSLAIEFGQCMHWIFEQAYAELERWNGILLENDVIVLEMAVKSLVKRYEAKWLEETPGALSKQLQQQEMVYGLAEAVGPEYFRRWRGDFTGKYSVKNPTASPVSWDSLEEIFKVPYTYPDGLVVPIRGRRDGVFRDKAGKVWVFDTKCRSVINHDEALETLPFDLQQMLYSFVTHEQGLKPVGTVMNIVRRPGQRQLQTESLPVFLARVKKEVENPKNTDHYFTRYQMAITRAEVYAWKASTLDPIMEDVRAWAEGRAPHYLNANNLTTKYGHCSMYLPIVKNEYGFCYKRKKVFAELPEVS